MSADDRSVHFANCELQKRIIYVTGLPRSGSTLLCQLLGTHPEIYSPGHSSPLCQTLNQLRHNLSDNDFLLAQLDVDFEGVHRRLLNAFRGFIEGWFAETEHAWVVDKNRGWLGQLDTVQLLDPNCKMLVCVRELGQIIGSVEARHQRSLLLDFPDHTGNLSRYARADKLMAAEGVVGGPLKAIEHTQDLPEALQQRLYYVVFEHLMQEPVTVMQGVYDWLGLPPASFDLNALPVAPHESDSYYRGKYPHRTHSRIQPPERHAVPTRIEAELRKNFAWFYQTFYPNLLG